MEASCTRYADTQVFRGYSVKIMYTAPKLQYSTIITPKLLVLNALSR